MSEEKQEVQKQEVQKQENYDLSIFEGNEQTGFEGTDVSTFKTPFLKILQGLSPELSKSNPKYIPNAQIGQFCNSATQMLYDNVDIIVLKVEHSLIVWKPNRGGFVGRYPKREEENIVVHYDGVSKWDGIGNEVVDTIEFFCVNANDPTDLFIMPLAIASLKHAKAFATRLRMFKIGANHFKVSWAGVWNITTIEERNDKGVWSTIGNTPKFVRLITKEEKENIVVPAFELFKNSVADYSTIDGDQNQESVDASVEY